MQSKSDDRLITVTTSTLRSWLLLNVTMFICVFQNFMQGLLEKHLLMKDEETLKIERVFRQNRVAELALLLGSRTRNTGVLHEKSLQ